jgi:hypothetical protein
VTQRVGVRPVQSVLRIDVAFLFSYVLRSEILIMNTYFPNPTVQAMILLDEADDDLCAAIELAVLSARTEKYEGDRYWFAVLDALTVEERTN